MELNKRGAKLKHPYDEVKRGRPITVTVEGEPSNGYKHGLAADAVDTKVQHVRTNVSAYGSRHKVKLGVRIKSRSADLRTVKLEVFYIGRRP
jgi:hypothetical protein